MLQLEIQALNLLKVWPISPSPSTAAVLRKQPWVSSFPEKDPCFLEFSHLGFFKSLKGFCFCLIFFYLNYNFVVYIAYKYSKQMLFFPYINIFNEKNQIPKLS